MDKLCRYSPGYSVLWRFCLDAVFKSRPHIETEELKECLRRDMSSKCNIRGHATQDHEPIYTFNAEHTAFKQLLISTLHMYKHIHRFYESMADQSVRTCKCAHPVRWHLCALKLTVTVANVKLPQCL